ncbi:MAG: AAA family ATPase [Veillonellaceae bacterium]|nr:AAA family ATPase [Veillonellaceae bacterium]
MGKIIAIMNQKGGVGKTTTAVNLAACLAEMGKRVLLADMDAQGNASSGLGISKEEIRYSTYDVLIEDVAVTDVVQPTALKHLSVLPATIALAGAEVELVNVVSRETKLREVLRGVRDTYDYILIDCPPSLGLLTINALVAADSVLIPIQCEYYALEGVAQLLQTVRSVGSNWNPALRVEGVVLTMFDGRTNLSLQVAEEVKRFFGDKVYRTFIPRNVRLSEAPSYGESIIQYDSRSKGARVYRELAKEVVGRD